MVEAELEELYSRFCCIVASRNLGCLCPEGLGRREAVLRKNSVDRFGKLRHRDAWRALKTASMLVRSSDV